MPNEQCGEHEIDLWTTFSPDELDVDLDEDEKRRYRTEEKETKTKNGQTFVPGRTRRLILSSSSPDSERASMFVRERKREGEREKKKVIETESPLRQQKFFLCTVAVVVDIELACVEKKKKKVLFSLSLSVRSSHSSTLKMTNERTNVHMLEIFRLSLVKDLRFL